MKENRVTVRQFEPGTEYRKTLKDIGKTGIKNIVLDVPIKSLYTVSGASLFVRSFFLFRLGLAARFRHVSRSGRLLSRRASTRALTSRVSRIAGA